MGEFHTVYQGHDLSIRTSSWGVFVQNDSFTASLAELEVLQLESDGLSHKEKAEILRKAHHTVKNQASDLRLRNGLSENMGLLTLIRAANAYELLNPYTMIGLASLAHAVNTTEVIERQERRPSTTTFVSAQQFLDDYLPKEQVDDEEPIIIPFRSDEEFVDIVFHPPSATVSTDDFSATVRELEILLLRSHGLTTAQVAQQLGISPDTVRNLTTTLMDRNRFTDEGITTSITELAVLAEQHQLLSPFVIIALNDLSHQYHGRSPTNQEEKAPQLAS